jgi:hypothetical protein
MIEDWGLRMETIKPLHHRELDLAWQFVSGMIANMIVKANDSCRSAH